MKKTIQESGKDREIEELKSQIEQLQECLKQTMNIALEAQTNANRVSKAVKTAQDGVDFTLKIAQNAAYKADTAQEGVNFTLKFAENTHRLALEIQDSVADRMIKPSKTIRDKLKNIMGGSATSKKEEKVQAEDPIENIDDPKEIDENDSETITIIDQEPCTSTSSPRTKEIYKSLKSKSIQRCLLLRSIN